MSKEESEFGIDNTKNCSGQCTSKIIAWLEGQLKKHRCASEITNQILTVCSEISSNILKHADYSEDLSDAQRIKVATNFLANGVEIRFYDSGPPFNPLKDPQCSEAPLQPGGRGIKIMEGLSNRICYERLDGGINLMKLYFKTEN